MKRLRSIFLKAFVFILSAILIAGAFGISYQVHYCCNVRHGIAFYPELGFQDPVRCGCSAKIPSKKNDKSEITSGSCCKDESFNNRLIPEYSQNHSYRSLDVISTNLSGLSSSAIVTTTDNTLPIVLPYLRPPPLGGRQLVLFLSQQRIPHEIYS